MNARRDIVVIGASAGGVEALRTLVGHLPAGLPAAVLVVLHLPPQSDSALPAILDRCGPLAARIAEHGLPIEPGNIYVAKPGRHLVVADGHLVLTKGPRENGHRPAVDVLFRTAARTFGPRVIAVVLSGALDDGTAGLLAVAARGGVTVAQDPGDAHYPAMPESAIEHAAPDHVLPAEQIAALIDRRCREQVDPDAVPEVPIGMQTESQMSEFERDPVTSEESPGVPSSLTCPDCAGALFEVGTEDIVRFRCRVGHAWTAESLSEAQGLAFEGALWMAMRSLEERAALGRQMADSARARGNSMSATRFEQMADDAAGSARLIHELMERVDVRDLGGSQVREPQPPRSRRYVGQAAADVTDSPVADEGP
ncbi:MAG: chemotaxis protein CheB [Mycobacteriales bacterium]